MLSQVWDVTDRQEPHAGRTTAARGICKPWAHGDCGYWCPAGPAWHGAHPVAASRIFGTAGGFLTTASFGGMSPLPSAWLSVDMHCISRHLGYLSEHAVSSNLHAWHSLRKPLTSRVLHQGGGGFGASAGPFMPMHMMGGGFPGQMPGPGPGFRQPQQPAAPHTREVRCLQHSQQCSHAGSHRPPVRQPMCLMRCTF